MSPCVRARGIELSKEYGFSECSWVISEDDDCSSRRVKAIFSEPGRHFLDKR